MEADTGRNPTHQTPPFARAAAPLIATACVLAANATTEATSSLLSKGLRSEVGRIFSKNCFLLFRHARDEIAGTFRRRRARQNRVHGDTGPARPRATATWAVLVKHLRWNVLAGFAGDENDATPVFRPAFPANILV